MFARQPANDRSLGGGSRGVAEPAIREVKLIIIYIYIDIYIDGTAFGDHVMIGGGAVGVDTDGNKHVPAIRQRTTENVTVV